MVLGLVPLRGHCRGAPALQPPSVLDVGSYVGYKSPYSYGPTGLVCHDFWPPALVPFATSISRFERLTSPLNRALHLSSVGEAA